MKTSGFIFIGLMTALLASNASADVYSGTLCNANGGTTGSAYDQFGIHNNSTATPLSVSCGAVASAGAISSVSITVYDRSTTDDVRCNVSIVNTEGSALFSVGLVTIGSANGPLVLSTGVPNIGGTVVLNCSLPANTAFGTSYVTTYTIR